MIGERIERVTGKLVRAWNSRGDVPAVLCADDDENIRALCAAAVARLGYEVDVAANGREAMDKLRRRHYAAVLLDLGMPYLHGATVIALLRRNQPETLQRVVVISGGPEAMFADLEGQVSSILRKPVGYDRILEAISRCVGDETVRLRPAT